MPQITIIICLDVYCDMIIGYHEPHYGTTMGDNDQYCGTTMEKIDPYYDTTMGDNAMYCGTSMRSHDMYYVFTTRTTTYTVVPPWDTLDCTLVLLLGIMTCT